MNWEYRIVSGSTDNKEDRELTEYVFNTMGAEGWELVAITPEGYGYFKRALPAPQPIPGVRRFRAAF